jgi:hypothetical protein
MRTTKLWAIFSILLMASPVLASPDTTLSITPSATAGSTITAADENDRNNDIATAFNAHSHLDISAMSSVNSFTIGDGTAGTKSYLVNDEQASSPGIRYTNSTGYWEISTDGTTFNAINYSSGVVIVGENLYRIGDNLGTNNKRIVFNEDTTDGEIRWNVTTDRVELSNNASTYTAIGLSSGQVAQPVASEDDFFIGDGTNNAPKRIYANTAAALGAKPQIRYNTADNTWEASDNGTTFVDIAGSESGTWEDVTVSRSGGTVYQNLTGKKKRVAVIVTGSANAVLAECFLEVESANPPTIQTTSVKVGVAASGGEAHKFGMYTEVPNNHYYRLTLGSGASISEWHELNE